MSETDRRLMGNQLAHRVYSAMMAAWVVTGFGIAAVRADEAVPIVFEPGVISTGFDESHPAFSPDGRSLYFLRNTPDFSHWTILVSTRGAQGWTPPSIAPFSGRWSDADVFITHDSKSLYFVSTRPVDGHDKEDTDIWVMNWDENEWGVPRHVPELSSPGFEWFPTMTDQGVIYFGSEREGGAGKSDLWRAHWLGDHFSTPENLGPIFNSPAQEIEPLIAPNESWLIFAANGRSPSAGSYDLYVSFNCPEGWSAPVPLGAGVNSDQWDFAPRFSVDGTRFFFASNRSDTAGEFAGVTTVQRLEQRLSAPRNGLRDIYSIAAKDLGLRSKQCAR